VYPRSLKSKEIAEDIANNGITCMTGVPLLFEKLYHSIRRGIRNAPVAKRMMVNALMAASSASWKLGLAAGKPLFRHLRQKAGLGSIRLFVSGGAAIAPEIARFFNLLGFDFLPGYGLSECSPVVSVNRPGDIKFGSVGPLLANLEARIGNPDSDGIGEILIKGGAVMAGYRDNAEATAKTVRDGWLYTGDLGCLKDGHLWITGRAKNLIVSGAGKNIYPEEIEEKLATSSYVGESVVFGRAKEGKQGEEVWAIIVPDLEQFRDEFNMSLDEPDLRQIRPIIESEVLRINETMAGYKRIARFEVQLEELEKTSTRKVKRFLYK
jgi:long-chain acyl-CoA synthetase